MIFSKHFCQALGKIAQPRGNGGVIHPGGSHHADQSPHIIADVIAGYHHAGIPQSSQLLHSQIPVTPEELPALANLLNSHFTGIGAEEMGQKLMGLASQLGAELFMPLSLAIEYASGVIE